MDLKDKGKTHAWETQERFHSVDGRYEKPRRMHGISLGQDGGAASLSSPGMGTLNLPVQPP